MTAQQGLIVVGLDGSPASRAALDFALDEGAAHGCTVEVVTAWLWSSAYEGMGTVGSITEGQEAARHFQDQALLEALGTRSQRPVVSQTVVHDDAGRALVHRSQGAAMLVVGSGRKGAVARTVLGSVSEYCVRHAPVPVVVVAETSGEVPGGRPHHESMVTTGP
jgi:nucleotide-binding universal stress UspA family protein